MKLPQRLGYHIILQTRRCFGVDGAPGLRMAMLAIETHAEDLGIALHGIGGYIDHIHLLLSLHPGQTLHGVIQLLKKISSPQRPEVFWRNEYSTFAVKKKKLKMACAHIESQSAFHQEKSLSEELRLLALE